MKNIIGEIATQTAQNPKGARKADPNQKQAFKIPKTLLLIAILAFFDFYLTTENTENTEKDHERFRSVFSVPSVVNDS